MPLPLLGRRKGARHETGTPLPDFFYLGEPIAYINP